MTKITKIAALVASGLAGISAAQGGTTDLLLGFNDAAGPGSAQNDYVIDLGVSGNVLENDANANGGTYDLSSTFNSSTFSTAFGADSSALNNVAVGVVGGITGSSPSYLFQTVLTGNTPGTINIGEFNNAAPSAGAPTVGEYSSGTSGGWTYYVAASPTAPGTDIAGDNVGNQTGNPLVQLTSGVASLDLWEITKTTSGLRSTLGSWTDLGTFNINVPSDSITFTSSAVPEPGASSLLAAGAGFLLVVLRQHIKRKNA